MPTRALACAFALWRAAWRSACAVGLPRHRRARRRCSTTRRRRRRARCSSTAATCRSRCSSPSKAGPRCATRRHDRLDRRASRSTDKRMCVVRPALADVRATPEEAAPVVFRAEQNVLLELAETAASPSAHRDARLGEGAPSRRAERLRAHRAGLRALRSGHPPAMTRAHRGRRRRRLGHRARGAPRGARARGARTSRCMRATRRQAQRARAARENARYLPGIALPARLAVAAGPRGVRRRPTCVLAAVPVARCPTLVDALRAAGARRRCVFSSKGFVASARQPRGARADRTQSLAPRWPAPVGGDLGPELRRWKWRAGCPRRWRSPRRARRVAHDVAAIGCAPTRCASTSRRHRRRRDRRRGEERARDRRGCERRPGLRPQRARGADHARPRRDGPAVGGAGRPARHA